VIWTVRQKFSCRSWEMITQPPAPLHVIARGRAGPDLLATILHAKFSEHQPLNRQSKRFFHKGIDDRGTWTVFKLAAKDASAGPVGACCVATQHAMRGRTKAYCPSRTQC
jgi:transposase